MVVMIEVLLPELLTITLNFGIWFVKAKVSVELFGTCGKKEGWEKGKASEKF